MNTQNVVTLTGRIPQTDKIKYEFTSGEDVSKNRLNGYVSVRRAYKKKDEQYYKEDLLKFVAFGQTATYLSNNANKGDTVQLVGSIEVSDNWVDENNVTHYGQPYIRVDAGTKVYGASDNRATTNNTTSTSTTNTSSVPISNPLLAKAKRNLII